MENGVNLQVCNEDKVVTLLDQIVIARLNQALEVCDPEMTGPLECVLSYFGG
jgi:hypothetical protein